MVESNRSFERLKVMGLPAPISGTKLRPAYRILHATACSLAIAGFFVTGGSAKTPVRQDVQERRLMRGKYLVEGPAHCFGCHSDPDAANNTDQPVPGRKGAGAVFPADLAASVGIVAPYRIVCPNITPDRETGAGTWKDEDFVRALRQGIGHDGRTLLPLMPYMNFQHLSEEDILSIVTYVRSIPAVNNPLPKINLPPPLLAALKPLPPPTSVHFDLSTAEKRGEYLARTGNCSTCHTPVDEQQQPLPGLYLAGGRTFPTPWGVITSANITPDVSGISYYDRKMFIAVIRTGHVGARKLNPFMPASYFRNMTDQDLSDIFAYLRTVSPVSHRVDNTEGATSCKVCRGKHGFGAKN
jgi:mono/diheme cytochrome c family protein